MSRASWRAPVIAVTLVSALAVGGGSASGEPSIAPDWAFSAPAGPGQDSSARGVAVDETSVFTTGFTRDPEVFNSKTPFTQQLDLATGAPGWKVAEGGMSVAVGPDPEAVYVAPGPVALDRETGEKIWERDLFGTQVVSGGTDRLYLAGPHRIDALDPSDGATIWHRGTGDVVQFFVSSDGSRVFSVSTNWRYTIFCEDDEVNYGDLRVTAFRASDGATIWSRRVQVFDMQDDGAAMSPNGKTIYVAGWATFPGSSYRCFPRFESKVVAIDTGNGTIRWLRKGRDPVLAGLLVGAGGNDLFFSHWKRLTAVGAGAHGGVRWTANGYFFSDLAVGDDGNIIGVMGSATAKIFAFAPDDGHLEWSASYLGPMGDGEFWAAIAVIEGGVVVAGAESRSDCLPGSCPSAQDQSAARYTAPS